MTAIDHSAVAEEVNAGINYTIYAVFRVDRGKSAHTQNPTAEILQRMSQLPELTIRGWYDLAGYRADADLLLWAHAPNPEVLQEAYRVIAEVGAGRLVPVWSNMAVHRAAEFNRGHVPAFLAGETPRDYVCVYPFVRSYDWYLLPDEERRQLLREHGLAARNYGDVLANTMASFALGDYEWLLAFEANDLLRIVDLMRELRATGARRHVREETPFFTGRREAAEQLLSRLFA
ncbi:hydrogen peroxide-dependent heme synthase [Canibacter zhoujuaniae]|uniref:hydrogen peroxide-dependent heme synthase n=1 Tax=Canibacter zhoujuaniae TaxID=2708343 RepID=UPI00141E3B1B|nr:hydrogen peroxide-dependent heme synthase [Canibacter zhoujuaniae]